MPNITVGRLRKNCKIRSAISNKLESTGRQQLLPQPARDSGFWAAKASDLIGLFLSEITTTRIASLNNNAVVILKHPHGYQEIFLNVTSTCSNVILLAAARTPRIIIMLLLCSIPSCPPPPLSSLQAVPRLLCWLATTALVCRQR